MPSDTDVARELYVAFERADRKLLLELLHPDFVGHVSEGMPGGWGGTHVGPAAMLTEVWGPAWRRFRVRPVPDRFLSCDDGTVVVTGTYLGQPPGAGPPLEAAFAHVLALRDGQVCELRQITDTRRWAQAAAAADAGLVRQLFAAVEERDGAAVLDAYATGVVIREAPSLPYGGVYHGHDGALRHALAYTATWDHLQSAEDRKLQPQIRGCDDRVVVTWRQKATVDLNVRGTLFTVQKALPLFVDGGSIFLNGSIASIKGFPAFGVYSASKAAVRSFARTWLVDLKERKIRVNILSPGTIDTPILDPLGPEAKEYFKTLIPRGEIGRPEEIATVALFLASSDSSFVNGVELFVDGGTAQI